MATERQPRCSHGHPDVTAIYCYNDLTAIGLLRGLREAGRRVPDDISVVGLDDIAAASWTAPSLTTVAQRKAEMGRLAVESIVEALEDGDGVLVPSVVRLSATLCARESTAPVRSAQG